MGTLIAIGAVVALIAIVRGKQQPAVTVSTSTGSTSTSTSISQVSGNPPAPGGTVSESGFGGVPPGGTPGAATAGNPGNPQGTAQTVDGFTVPVGFFAPPSVPSTGNAGVDALIVRYNKAAYMRGGSADPSAYIQSASIIIAGEGNQNTKDQVQWARSTGAPTQTAVDNFKAFVDSFAGNLA